MIKSYNVIICKRLVVLSELNYYRISLSKYVSTFLHQQNAVWFYLDAAYEVELPNFLQ